MTLKEDDPHSAKKNEVNTLIACIVVSVNDSFAGHNVLFSYKLFGAIL